MFERIIAEQNRLLGARLDASDAASAARFDRIEKKVDDLNAVHAVQAGHTARLDGHDRELVEVKATVARDAAENDQRFAAIDQKFEGASSKVALIVSAGAALVASAAAVIALFLR